LLEVSRIEVIPSFMNFMPRQGTETLLVLLPRDGKSAHVGSEIW